MTQAAVTQPGRLRGRVGLITGAASGIGAAILAGRGAGVLPEDPPPGPQPDDAGHAVPGVERALRPSPARRRAYDQLYARWLRGS